MNEQAAAVVCAIFSAICAILYWYYARESDWGAMIVLCRKLWNRSIIVPNVIWILKVGWTIVSALWKHRVEQMYRGLYGADS